MTMNLTNAKLGEIYEVYLDKELYVVDYGKRHIGMGANCTELTMKATIIGCNNHLVVLGWGVDDSIAASGSLPINGVVASLLSSRPATVFISNLKDFSLALWAPKMLTVKQCLSKLGSSLTTGHTCKECSDFCAYAEHDLSTGAFKCSLCKSRARLFG